MRDELINATEEAIHAVEATRFFQTERGFHGRFYCALQNQLDRAGLMVGGAILEMEYQKSRRHGLYQRPDIVFHIPVEYSGADVRKNNFAVWALKHRASETDARLDFDLLNEMFEVLHYPFGFFLNIDATNPMLQYYEGNFSNRMFTVAAKKSRSKVQTYWAPKPA